MADTSAVIANRQTANAPTIQTGTVALATNPARAGWSIQNVGTGSIAVLLGSGVSDAKFHFILKGGTAVQDGLGGSFTQTSGAVYTGVIQVTGTSPTYTVLEIQ